METSDGIPVHEYQFGAPDTCKCCGESAFHENHFFYREENSRWSDDVLAISAVEFVMMKRTPSGAWLRHTWDHDGLHKRFVLEGKGRRYAYPTRQLARESFIIRKRREIQRCAAQHDRAVRYLALAETGKFGTRTEALHEISTTDLLLPEK